MGIDIKIEPGKYLCDGKGVIDLGPQGAYSFVGERWAKCPGCGACKPTQENLPKGTLC